MSEPWKISKHIYVRGTEIPEQTSRNLDEFISQWKDTKFYIDPAQKIMTQPWSLWLVEPDFDWVVSSWMMWARHNPKVSEGLHVFMIAFYNGIGEFFVCVKESNDGPIFYLTSTEQEKPVAICSTLQEIVDKLYYNDFRTWFYIVFQECEETDMDF